MIVKINLHILQLFLILQEKILEMKYIKIIKQIELKHPEDLAPQFEYIRKSVEAFNVVSAEMLNYEADDLIATYTKQILEKGAKVTISFS